jgi:two-component system, cell cycle sensor histidine kinase PleC
MPEATQRDPESGRRIDERRSVAMNELVHLVAAGRGLGETLTRIAQAVESLAPPAICAIELVDAAGGCLRHGAAPSLPDSYRRAVDGLAIGPGAGACGTAVYLRQPVIVRDMRTDPLFAPYLALAEELGLRACWSLPIMGDGDAAIGAFALYHRTPCEPSAEEWNLVASMSGLVRLALMQHRREQALRHAKEEAEAASRAKSQFLAHMSHELRTPLNAILGFSEVIRESLMGPLDVRYREYGGDVHKAGQHLLTLINDVLDLAKIEVGRMELAEETVVLRDLIAGALSMVRETAERAGVAVVTDIGTELPPLRADRLRLKQAVLNLLSNALKFTPIGGEVRIAATLRADGDALLQISDNGIGMRPEDIPLALSPFGQVDDALNRRHRGTGLGLPLAKTLVELHGGRLEIDSAPGRGTTASIVLPRQRLLPTG